MKEKYKKNYQNMVCRIFEPWTWVTSTNKNALLIYTNTSDARVICHVS